jgi:GH25 family lysozyme M1 (1,4-beta-N-acetylmuramidase)
MMNWGKAYSAGARFAFIRAGSISTAGECYTDYQFERNSEIAPDFMPVGYYWYFRPQFDAKHQASYFCNLIRSKRRLLPPGLDLENCGDPPLPPSKITTAGRAFALEVYNRLDVWPLLYSRALWLNENTITDEVLKNLDLWIARYKVLPGPWSDGACIPRDYSEWVFWQYSANNNGLGPRFGAQSASIDIDQFNGSEKKFSEYCGAAMPRRLRITAALAVTVRNGPEGSAIGATWRGSEWRYLGQSNDGNYYRVEAWLPADKVEEV